MKTIYKYPLNIMDQTIIQGSIEKFLCVDYQKDSKKACAWAQVDDEVRKEEYIVTPYGTNHRLPSDPGTYIGTIQFYSGETVLHFYVKRVDAVQLERERLRETEGEFERI